MAILEMFPIPGELTVSLVYNDANFRITEVSFTNNFFRREAELKIKVPPRAVVSVKTAATSDNETVVVQGNDGTGVIWQDPDDGDAQMALNSEIEFQPGEKRV